MTPDDDPAPPVFSAVTSSGRQIYALLKCCGFEPRAQVRFSQQGLMVTVEGSHVMQGAAFINKQLFSSYSLNPPPPPPPQDPAAAGTGAGAGAQEHAEGGDNDDGDDYVEFSISLAVLLECLQIFGGAEASSSRERWHGANGGGQGGGGGSGPGSSTSNSRGPGAVFDQTVLRIGGTCRFSYRGQGHPLHLTLEENGVVTTCELATYEAEDIEQIPLALDELAMKLIMKASWLHDAIQELEGSSVERLTIAARPQHPYFSLSASGPMGSTTVEFSNDRSLLQSFNVPSPTQHSYKFRLVRNAAKAMAMASKVSIRGDVHGVLSLQFMIEQEGGGTCFVDFRFIPLTVDDGDDDD